MKYSKYDVSLIVKSARDAQVRMDTGANLLRFVGYDWRDSPPCSKEAWDQLKHDPETMGAMVIHPGKVFDYDETWWRSIMELASKPF